MIQNIREFLEDCFANAPKTQKISELKEELFANMCDKYNDLVSGGMSQDKAFRRVVDNVGNIDELIRNLTESAPDYVRRLNEQRKKTALVITCSIATYMFAVLLMSYLTVIAHVHPVLSSLIFLGICVIPTIWMIYYFMSRPKLLPPNMDVSELAGFAVHKKADGTTENKKTGALLAIFAPLSVIIFFIIGFGFGGWAWGWLIFLFTPVIAGLAKYFDRNR